MEVSKKDWKLFREKITLWQEQYMEKLAKEFATLLNEDVPASTKFWQLEKRIKKEKNKPGVIIDLRKSEMMYDILSLIHDGAITMDDLSEFSDELKEHVKRLQRK